MLSAIRCLLCVSASASASERERIGDPAGICAWRGGTHDVDAVDLGGVLEHAHLPLLLHEGLALRKVLAVLLHRLLAQQVAGVGRERAEREREDLLCPKRLAVDRFETSFLGRNRQV